MFINLDYINILFIEQHILIIGKYKNMLILFDEKLNTDFCTDDR